MVVSVSWVVVAVIGGLLLYSQRRSIAWNEVWRLVNPGGLPKDEKLMAAAQNRFVQRQEATIVGGWLGGVLCVAFLAATGSPLIAFVWAVLFGSFGAAVANFVVHFRVVRAARQPGPRTAALRPRRLTDFLVGPEVAVQYGVLALPLVSAALGVLVLAGDDHPRRGWVLLVVSAVALLIYGVASILQRRVLRLSLGGSVASTFEWPVGLPSFVAPLTYVLFGGGVVLMAVAQLSGNTKRGLRRSQRAIG